MKTVFTDEELFTRYFSALLGSVRTNGAIETKRKLARLAVEKHRRDYPRDDGLPPASELSKCMFALRDLVREFGFIECAMDWDAVLKNLRRRLEECATHAAAVVEKDAEIADLKKKLEMAELREKALFETLNQKPGG